MTAGVANRRFESRPASDPERTLTEQRVRCLLRERDEANALDAARKVDLPKGDADRLFLLCGH